MIRKIAYFVILLSGLFSGMVANASEIDALLQRQKAPEGVVFEVIQGDRTALEWVMPRISNYAGQLREKFPGIQLAVVTHGVEQFGLQTRNTEKAAKTHETVQDLVGSQNVPVHVCGTHASWYDVTADDFPDYVDVAPSGPAQINAYRELGYELVIIQ